MVAEDIGTWMPILQLTSVFAVMTNGALICYTMDILSVVDSTGKVWIFLALQYFVFFVMAIFSAVVDDVTEEVRPKLT